MTNCFQTGTIPQTLQRLKEEGYCVTQCALRSWVKTGKIPARYCGNKAYLYYPNVILFLQGGDIAPMDEPEVHGIRKIG